MDSSSWLWIIMMSYWYVLFGICIYKCRGKYHAPGPRPPQSNRIRIRICIWCCNHCILLHSSQFLLPTNDDDTCLFQECECTWMYLVFRDRERKLFAHMKCNCTSLESSLETTYLSLDTNNEIRIRRIYLDIGTTPMMTTHHITQHITQPGPCWTLLLYVSYSRQKDNTRDSKSHSISI